MSMNRLINLISELNGAAPPDDVLDDIIVSFSGNIKYFRGDVSTLSEDEKAIIVLDAIKNFMQITLNNSSPKAKQAEIDYLNSLENIQQSNINKFPKEIVNNGQVGQGGQGGQGGPPV